MSYQALYRTHRPQTFDDLIGQEAVKRVLLNALRQNKVAHAYLFTGPRGTGKTSTARILAMALNCENPQEGEPCGVCDSCVAVRQGTSLDVQELDHGPELAVDHDGNAVAEIVGRDHDQPQYAAGTGEPWLGVTC